MAIKLRAEGPPPLQMVPDNVDSAPTAKASIPSPVVRADKAFASNPELDARLNTYMAVDPKTTEYYTRLVQENPDRAVRKLMLNEMKKHEENMQYISKVMPQVKEWLKEQPPEVQKRIQDRVQHLPPIHQDAALVREAKTVKMRMEFAPKPREAMSTVV